MTLREGGSQFKLNAQPLKLSYRKGKNRLGRRGVLRAARNALQCTLMNPSTWTSLSSPDASFASLPPPPTSFIVELAPPPVSGEVKPPRVEDPAVASTLLGKYLRR